MPFKIRPACFVLHSVTFCFVFLLSFLPVTAQVRPDSELLNMVNGITAATTGFPPEKIYIQTDKPFYNTGDTLWFKVYLFNAAAFTASAKSGMAYLEVADEHGKVLKRQLIALGNGVGWGDIVLSEKDYPDGIYTLRAYTNWMRNFGTRDIFQYQFSVHDFSKNDWLVNTQFEESFENNRPLIRSRLQFDQINGRPVLFRDLELKLTDGSKVWYKNRVRTDVNGMLDINFDLPDKADRGKLSLVVDDLRKNEPAPELTVPLILHKPIDLQFMPEGGDLVGGITEKVAFKALGVDGMHRDVEGTVFDEENHAVAEFRSSHLGVGSFYFTPEYGKRYFAEVNLGSDTARYALPPVKKSGIALQVKNVLENDSIEISVIATPDLINSRDVYYLVAEARGIGCFGALVSFKQAKETFRISKNIFPTGIARFILMNADKQPICRRIVFIDLNDGLQADLTYKKQYTTRDSVGIDIKVSDKTGRPVQGSFSIAITDDNKVNIDTIQRNSMVSYAFLTSDLKGYVEDPGYYFSRPRTKKIWEDLDNLLLAQGWASYTIDTVSKLYPPEYSFSIEGKVTNIFNKPVEDSKVLMLSRKPFAIRETTTSKDGRFIFDDLFPIDTASFMIQAKNKRGKSFNIGIEVYEFKPPVIKPVARRMIPWYVNIDTASLPAIQESIADNEKINKLLGKHVLKEVVVVGQKVIKDSKNLNGPGGSDFALNQSDMEKEGKATLEDVLRQKVKGFRLGGKYLDMYMIYTEKVHFIIDGVNLDFFKPGGMSDKDFYRQYLDYLTAEDIKGIEVMTSSKYTIAYFRRFLNPMDHPFEHAFIEVTTYSGNGAFLKKTPGVYLYRPELSFSMPQKFYSPVYKVNTANNLPDVRSTIYWNPNIVTDENGKAHISFYTADKPGTYTVIFEGSDMNGNIVSKVKKIVVE